MNFKSNFDMSSCLNSQKIPQHANMPQKKSQHAQHAKHAPKTPMATIITP